MQLISLLNLLGRPFSPIYGFFMKLREKLYGSGLFASYLMPVPVISVGNLTMGGTGKTPAVEAIARLLQKIGYRPAVISRGYKGTAAEKANLVADTNSVLLDVKTAGDEPVMLARALPGIPVLTGTKRLYPCKLATKKLGCTALILDDGFQHLAIKRTVNLVLFNATTLAGNSRVFPGGELREPISSLNRADAFLLTGVGEENTERAHKFADLLQKKFNNRPVFFLTNSVKGVYTQQNTEISVDALPKDLLAFSGIAHPRRFHDLLTQCKIPVAGAVLFADHALYTSLEIERLVSVARKNRASGLITTEKDFVKLEQMDLPLHLFYVKIQTDLPQDFQEYLTGALNRYSAERYLKKAS